MPLSGILSGQGAVNEYSPLVGRSSPQLGEFRATDRNARSLASSQELPVPAGRLERLKTFILSPIRALMAWVNRLLNRAEPSGGSLITRAAVEPEHHLSFLAGGSPINRDNYNELVAVNGDLNRRLKELESLHSIEIEPFSGQAKALLEQVTQGVTARDWAAGSGRARTCITVSSHHTRVYIADELNRWDRSALALRDAAYAEIKKASDLSVFKSEPLLASLYDRVIDAATGGAFPWSTRKVFFELINTEIKGIEENISIREWAQRTPSATGWLETASELDRLVVTRQLEGWAKDASKHLDDAEARASGPDE